MPVSQDLLDFVVCPKCKGEIQLKPDQSAFVCRACRLVYAVVDEIPNFLIEEAQPLPVEEA